MSDFTHLHVHSDGSTPISHDGLGSVHRLVKAARELNFNSLALTDHGNLLNVPSFLDACESSQIKPIIGMEAYVSIDGETYHLTLLADGNTGFDTLVNLNNIAQQSFTHNRPVFKLTDFEKHNKGLLVLTGCMSSALQEKDWNTALDIGIYLKNIFGNRLFAEMIFIGFDETLERSVKLAQDLKLQLVVTNDSHFPYAKDAKAHEVLTSIRGGYDYPSDYLYLASVNDLTERVKAIAPKYLKYLEQGIKNAHKIASKIDVVKFENKISLPFIENANEELKKLIMWGLESRIHQKKLSSTVEVLERLDYEYKTISEMEFSTYFLILHDIVSYAKANNVKVGVGRGSGAGSLILYALGITDINPLEFGLKFERFINPKRLDFPDVDIDYGNGRDLVIDYAKKRWHGIPVATYSRYSHKSLIADLSRHFGVDKLSDRVMRDEGINERTYKEITKANPLFDECYRAINEQIRHLGKHAGGIIITDKNIPTIRTSNGDIVASWTEGLNGKELSKVGVVKFDILGITALDILAELEAKHGLPPHPYDNAPEYELFRTGDTLGIFQFTGSSGIIKYTKQVQPTKFSDLVAINALWRPGPMQGSAPHYVDYKKNGQRLLHPLIDDILEETYGVICYQEQFMEIYARVTGGDLGDADIARKTLVKSKVGNKEWEQKLAELERNFFNGCDKQGIKPKTAKTIWDEIKTHSGYSFNKSHAVSYTMMAWQMAYYKYHWRSDFYAAMLTFDDDKTEDYIYDVIRTGIEVSLPDINKSEKNRYVAVGDTIYMPLTSIKFISEASSDNILENRPFTSYSDFSERVTKKQVNKRAKKVLYYVGALKELSGLPEDMNVGIIEPMTSDQIQEQFLGFVLPKPAFFKAVEKAFKKGMIAGIVSRIVDKVSTYSGHKYQGYSLFPDGYFYSYDLNIARIGDEIQVEIVKDRYGNNRLKQSSRLEY